MILKLKKKYIAHISIAILAASIITISSLLFSNLYESFELKTIDLRFQLRRAIPQKQDILFVEMDQEAIEDMGRWPWPRDIFAHIIDTLKALKAKAILFDVTFTEPTQLVVDREKLSIGLGLKENKKIIQDFIADTKEAFTQGTVSPSEARDSLDQINEGIELWGEAIQKTFYETIKDNDLILAEAIKNAGNVYLGYHLEVIHMAKDIIRNDAYSRLKKQLIDWAEKNPEGKFIDLPHHLKNTPFSPEETILLLKRANIYILLNKNLELRLEDLAQALGEGDLTDLRAHYNDVKGQIFKERLEEASKKTPGISFKESVWELGLFIPADIQLLKEQYQSYTLEELFSKNIGIPYSDKEDFLLAIKLSPPILPLAKEAKGAGYLNAIGDKDGTLRKVPLFVRYKDKIYPHIALKLILDEWGINPKEDLRITPQFLEIRGTRIPVDKKGLLFVNWADKWQDSFEHLSCSEVYRLWQLKRNVEENLKLSPEEIEAGNLKETLVDDKNKLEEADNKLGSLVKDKICIIGLTAPGTHDYTPIPLQPDYPAVGTHANVLNTILEGNYLYEADSRMNLAIIFIIAILTGICAALFSPVGSAIASFLILSLYSLLCIFLFKEKGLLVDMVGPLSTVILSYVGIVSYNFATEEKEKRWIRNAFGHYVSKNVMEEILKDPSKLKLGGERKELTVLFSDIRSFTTYSEKYQPEEVVAILNEYLDEMTKVILKHNGTLDKYVGDEIMAIFGAPAASVETDHAQRAVATALDMLKRLKELQEKWKTEGKESLDIGIGINTGPMLVGNIGSTERMDYTVIGDAVNLGARIEALTRNYNNHLIISEFTYAYVKDMVEVKQLDSVKVKGKEKPVMMYEVLNLKEEFKDVKD
ncbi:MAG: adenylate/guanylate cyclase domain-containing protein [Candidatus Omnitrophica bacterium]|nr:adenylate/guanylate cyclase domain-containing protein [Candidatus Omnitrophota bacterium]